MSMPFLILPSFVMNKAYWKKKTVLKAIYFPTNSLAWLLNISSLLSSWILNLGELSMASQRLINNWGTIKRRHLYY